MDSLSELNLPRITRVIVPLLLAFWVLHLFRTWWRLRLVPGPFLASLSDLPRMFWVTTRRAQLIHQDLHAKYGDLVRVGPNTVIFSNPEAIPTVYPMRAGFPKSNFYAVLRPYQRGGTPLKAVFNTQDENDHKTLKNPIAPIFSLSNATGFEPLVDDVLACLERRIDERFVRSGEIFDLGDWLQFFAFDVMGTMTFSKRYGFLDQGKDVGGMIGAVHDFMETVAPMTQIYWLDKIIYKNRIADSIRRAPGLKIMQFVYSVIKERRQKIATGEWKPAQQQGKKDFLTRFIEIHDANRICLRGTGAGVFRASTAWTFSNVTAGSDSVGTVIRTTMYHLLSNPATLDKLRAELDAAGLSRPYPRFVEVRDLPYLEACVQEGVRMHPPFALPFERVVPPEGVTVAGYLLPGGTVVGGQPYVINRHRETFGDDAEFWRPERWLEGDDERKKRLERSMLTFGAGRRICLGKHIGLLEVKKLIPFLVLNYDMRIIDPKAFQVENIWFFKQKGLYTQISKRPTIPTGDGDASGPISVGP